MIINPIIFTPKHFVMGSKVFIRNNARLEAVTSYMGVAYTPQIEIGDNVSIEQNLHLTCANKISIGKNTAIAANVSITDINHPYENINLPPEKQQLEVQQVIIGEDSKIYNNVVILPGAILGKHTVVGANSVVPGKTFPDFCILAGIPAKIVKRFSFEKEAWLKTDENGNF